MLDPDDPLLPAPDPQPWLQLGTESEPASLEALQIAIQDYHSFHQVALPAFDADGTPLMPPEEHVLDHLARALGLVDADQTMLRPSVDTVAVVYELPECDRCRHGVLARYDALLDAGYGANLCTRCFRTVGHGRLGTGKGQYLLLTAEVTSPVRAVVDELTSRHGMPSSWDDEPGEPDWVRTYRECGFGGPDSHGRMSREVYGCSIVAQADVGEVVQVDQVSVLSFAHDGAPGDFRVPQEWPAAEVRHFLREAYGREQFAGRRSCSTLEEPLAAAEARTWADLDAQHFPTMIYDGVAIWPCPPYGYRPVRFPNARARAYVDAGRCAKHSGDPELIARLVREASPWWPRGAAVLNPVCPPEVLMDCCTGAIPDLRSVVVQRSDLTAEMLEALAQAAIEGPSSHRDDRWFIRAVAVHPTCPEEALPVLVHRVKAAPTRERVELAVRARALPLERRKLIATLLLGDARKSKVASAVIDTFIGVEESRHGTCLPDEEMLGFLVEHSSPTIRRLAQERVREVGLQEAFLA